MLSQRSGPRRFAEVGPPLESGHGRAPAPLDNDSGIGSQPVIGSDRRAPGSFRRVAGIGQGGSRRYVVGVLPRILLAVGSGGALSLAFEPVALPWLIPFGVAGLVLAVRGMSAGRACWPAWCFGIAFYFTHIYWMRGSVGTDAWLALAGIESLFYGALGPAIVLLGRLPAWPLWVAVAWTAMDNVRASWPFSGMPWGRLSFGVVDTPVAHALPYLGMSLLDLLLALLGASIAAVVAGARRRRAVLVALACAAVLLAPALHPWEPHEERRTTIAVVQGDVPGPGNDILYDHRQVTRNLAQATEQLAGDIASGETARPAFVVWPENSTAVDPFRDASTNAVIESAVASLGIPVLVSAIVDGGPDHVLNQGIVWDPDTGAGERYTKRHPVAFGEYVPLRSALRGFMFGRLQEIGRDMVAGTGADPLDIAGISVADAICFDVAYDDVFYDQVGRGAELITVQTSNVMFIFTDQIEQQFAMTRLRAIETGRYAAVASPNGVSGVIAPDGEVLARAPVRSTAVLSTEVGLVDNVTPAVRMGLWPGRVCVTLGALSLLFSLSFRRRRYGRAPLPTAQADQPVPDQRNETSLT